MNRRERTIRGPGRVLAGGICLAFPLLCGGCPDVRNGVVDAFERATIVLTTRDLGSDPEDVLQSGLTRTFLEIVFDKLRSQRP